MEKILENCNPNHKIKHLNLINVIPKEEYYIFKDKYVIFYMIYKNYTQLLEKKLLLFKKKSKIFECESIEMEIAGYLIYKTNEYLIDLWNYLHPGIIRRYINDTNELYLVDNMKNLLYLIKNYGLSFKNFNNLNYIVDYLKKDKKTLLEIIEYENIVDLWESKENILNDSYFITDKDFKKLLIKKCSNLDKIKNIEIDFMKIALINNQKSFIKFYLNNYKINLDFIFYSIYPEFENSWDEDKYYLYYYKKTITKEISNNLILIYNNLSSILGKDKVINYLLNTHCNNLETILFSSVIRFHCKDILKDIIDCKGLIEVRNILKTNFLLEDLFRYGQYSVLQYLDTLDNDTFLNSIINDSWYFHTYLEKALYNYDDRLTKYLLKKHIPDILIFNEIDFLKKNTISCNTKIRKLKILMKHINLDKTKIIEYSIHYSQNKLIFWLISKLFNNKLKDTEIGIKIINKLILSDNLNDIKKLLNNLDDSFNYWYFLLPIIEYNIEIPHLNFIIQHIFHKLDFIKKYPDVELNIINKLKYFKYSEEDSVKFYDKLLKIIKSSGMNLNFGYNLTPNITTNNKLFKIGILNGMSYPNFFRSFNNIYYFYRLEENGLKPYLSLYKLIKSLEFRKKYHSKKTHKKIFRDTTISIDSRPPNINIPVLAKGGQLYYNDLEEFNHLINEDEKFINPKHITPFEMLELVKEKILITPKIDGVTKKNIDKDSIFPEFPNEMEYHNIDAEYIKELDMYLVFGVRNNESITNCIYNDYINLKNIHPFTKKDSDTIITSSNHEILKKKLIDEYINIIKFYKKNKGKTLWYPKKFWLIFDTDIILDVITNLELVQKNIDESMENDIMINYINKNLIKTDGFILNKLNNKTDFYKLKPQKDMTIDLLYNGNWIDKENNVYNINSSKINDYGIYNYGIYDYGIYDYGIYRCIYQNNQWYAMDFRPEKKYPNPKIVVDIVNNFHRNPWNVEELKKYVKPVYYQEFKNSNKLKNINLDKRTWFNLYIKQNYKILDIGCGQLINQLWNNNSLVIDGIDNDLGTFTKFNKLNLTNKRVFIQDFTKKWDFNDDCIKKEINTKCYDTKCYDTKCYDTKCYDIILLNMSIHNCFREKDGIENLMFEINRKSDKNTKIMVSFIDKDTIFNNNNIIEFSDKGFIKKLDDSTIIYYFPWRHNKIIKEPILSKKDIISMFKSFNWNNYEEYKNKFFCKDIGYEKLAKSIKRMVFYK